MKISPVRFPAFRREHGFTLIELLTVIAIIGILAAIIIPVAGRVRASAQTSSCASNLRQLGVAFNLYAQENRGFLPAAKDNSQPWPHGWWQAKVQPYLERKRVGGSTAQNQTAVYEGVFRCPGKKDFDLAGPTDQQRTSYGMNTFGSANQAIPKRLDTIKNPSIVALVSDTAEGNGALRTNAYLYTSFKAQWHGGKDNVLFVDGHVELLGTNALNFYLVKTTEPLLQP